MEQAAQKVNKRCYSLVNNHRYMKNDLTIIRIFLSFLFDSLEVTKIAVQKIVLVAARDLQLAREVVR